MAVNHYLSSSSSSQEPDEISLFLKQIILRSSASSSSSYSFMPPQAFAAENQQPATVTGYPPSGANFSSSCFWNFENEPDEYEDYESEEAAASGGKPMPSRNSSKRSRAAEVHNLSEKRRRSRINEKMKALQNLIPNANKTDKASMLDEAIEYLKQLQLQVQLLTMRNGLSLYPICFPGIGMMQQRQISRMRIDVCDEQDKPSTTNNNMDQTFSSDALNNLHDNRGRQSWSAEFSMMVGSSRSSFKMEQSMRQPFRPFQLSQSSHKGICYKGLPFQQTVEQDQHSNDRSSPKENKTSEPCLAGPDHLLASFVNNPIFSSPLNM